jgi:hypothetical protein
MPAAADLVHQTSTSTGAAVLALTAVNGKRTFLEAFGTGGTNTFYYYVSNRDAPEWERGTGHENAGTLVRDTVIASSNANSAVDFSSGIKDITNDIPAPFQLDLSAPITANRFLAGPTAGGAGPASYRVIVAADIPALDTSKITTGVFPAARIDQTAAYNWTGAHGFTGTGGAGVPRINVVSTAPGNILDATGGKSATQFFATTGDSFVAFHMSAVYATYFGVRQGQQGFWYGGWSEGANAYQFHDTKGSGQATVGEMTAAASGAVYVSPANFRLHPGATKVWGVATDAGGAIVLQAAFNVSGVSDPGGSAGRIIWTFTAFANTAFAASPAVQETSTELFVQNWARTTTTLENRAFNDIGAATDPDLWEIQLSGPA